MQVSNKYSSLIAEGHIPRLKAELEKSDLPEIDRQKFLSRKEGGVDAVLRQSYILYPGTASTLRFIEEFHHNLSIRNSAEERLLELACFHEPVRVSQTSSDAGLLTLRRLLRELTRNTPRKFEYEISQSKDGTKHFIKDSAFSEARKLVGTLYAHEPIIPLTAEQKAISKLQALSSFKTAIASFLRHITEADWSWEQWSNQCCKLGLKPADSLCRPDLPLLILGQKSEIFNGYGSRTVMGYDDEVGINLVELLNDRIGVSDLPIKILDVGSYRGEALYGLKQRFGDEIEAHGLSLNVTPHFPCDFFHCYSADFMPLSFKGKFDLIVSSRCLEYVALADKALLGIAESLALGGVAELQWRSGRAADENSPRFQRLLDLNSPIKPSSQIIEILKKGANFGTRNNFSETAERQLKWTHQRIEKGEKFGVESRLSTAWVEAVIKLQSDSRFKVDVWGYTMSGIGAVPGRIRIERVSL